MNRSRTAILVLATVALLAACTPSTGGLGTLAPSSAEPTVGQGSPDVTPGPASPEPSAPASPGQSGEPGSPAPSSDPSNPAATPTPAPAETTIVRAYFWLNGEVGVEGLVPVLREVPRTQAVARAAIEQLLRGPVGRETKGGAISTAIPAGTRLLDVTIENGVATVDLSGEFESGGGTTSTMVRLGQVTYTLTQFTTVRSVLFRVDGETVGVFGSEGLVLDGPQARDDFLDLLPEIWVDRPAWGAAIGNPARVTGLANVFEAQFLVSILDGSGRVLVDEPVLASCGTGCWGTFDVTLDYTVDKAQYGTLRVYNRSAKDGSVESVRDYPVWLTPKG
jgi:germination protein M